MRPAFGNLWIVSQLSRCPREVVKEENPKKNIEKKKNPKKIEKGKIQKRKIQKNRKKEKIQKRKKKSLFGSPGQNVRLLSLPYS